MATWFNHAVNSPVIFSSDHSAGPMFVEYSNPSKTTGTSMVFSASYKVLGGCQKSMTASLSGQLFSPEFPNQYPFNAQCWHKLNIPDGKLVHLYFDTFNLYEKHTVDILNNTADSTLIGTYSGDVPPNDIIFTGTDVQVNFSSLADPTDLTVSQGYNISYTLIECGGNLTSSSANFTTPGYPDPVLKSTTCIWIISVQSPDAKFQNVTIVDLSFPTMKQTANNYIEIRDGPSLRSSNMMLNLTASTTNTTVQSTYNFLWVKYVFNGVDNNSKKGFSIQFSYKTLVCNATCENGICMHNDWICDGIDQCGDSSDEQNCPGKVCPQESKRKTSAGAIILTIVLTIAATVAVILAAPRVKRWLITRRYSSMNSDVTERI